MRVSAATRALPIALGCAAGALLPFAGCAALEIQSRDRDADASNPVVADATTPSDTLDAGAGGEASSAGDIVLGDARDAATIDATAEDIAVADTSPVVDASFDGATTQEAGVVDDRYQITSGKNHSCAWKRRGPIYCWGDNAGGQLGAGNTNLTLVPVQVQGLQDVVKVVVEGTQLHSSGHTCAVDLNGQLWCWGWNGTGQLGLGDTTNRSVPALVSNLSNVVDVGLGENHTCALDAAGAVYCWGSNDIGQLGDVAPAPAYRPALLRTAADAVDLTVGSFDGCLRTAGGQVRCWGANGTGQAGTGNTLAVSTPFAVPGITDAWAITMGTSYACALSRAGGVICWGAIDRSTLLNPTPIAGLPADLVGFAGNFYCALQAAGLVWCWGPIAPNYVSVSQIKPGLTDVASASGPCAVERNGIVLCNGTNSVGQLGDGTMNDSLDQPVPVTLP